MKHTSGTWELVKGNDFYDIQTKGMLCRCYMNWVTEEEAEAIARLMAAAPEMYEALKDIVDSGEIPYCESSKLVIKAKQAIAKATGEERVRE